jgi:GxxExxY protein
MTEILFKQECFQIVGACFEVHKNLGCGFLEPVYQEALAVELTEMNIPFVKEKNLRISYKKKQLEKFYVADFICYDSIILELKALSAITSQHEAQVINYLKATGIKLGLLINFGESSLKYKRLLL